MRLLKNTKKRIKPPDREIMKLVKSKFYNLLDPPGRLGRLEELVSQYAGITGIYPPVLSRKCIILAAADHGVAELGVSAYPIETTAHMVRNYLLAKGAGANALANFCRADMVVVDMGVAGDLSDVPGLLHKKIASGTRNFTLCPAMSRRQAVRCLETGIEIADQQAKKGPCCFSLGEMGIGNTTSSAAIAAAFAGISPEQATGRGTGISDARLKIKIEAVRKGLALHKPDPDDGIDVLSKIGGFEIGGLAGVILGAAANRCPVIIDGFNSSAAALIASAIEPLCKNYMLPSHLSAEPGHAAMLDLLGLQPYINMGLRLGEATGASLAMSLLELSVKTFNQLSSGRKHVPAASGKQYNDSGDLSHIEELVAAIRPPDRQAMEICQSRIDNLAKPLGSLHGLEHLAVKMAGITRRPRPHDFKKSLILLSSSPPSQQENTAWSLAVANIFAEHAKAELVVENIVPPVNQWRNSVSVTRGQVIGAIEAGVNATRDQLSKGAQIIGFGELETENLTNSHTSAAKLIDKLAKYQLVTSPDLPGLLDDLAATGNPQIAAMTGAILAAAAGEAAAVLDGAVSGAAALMAMHMAPQIKDYLVGSLFPLEPVHKSSLDCMNIPAYLHLGIKPEAGTGAALGILLIEASLHVLNDMKTFGEAQVAIAQDGPGALVQSREIR